LDDDGIDDTPLQFKCTQGKPASSVILDQCTDKEPGIMWMNYMDYVDDIAMVMFTPEQINVMESTFSTYEWMKKLANTGACSFTTSVNNFSGDAIQSVKIYPNPVNNQFTAFKGNISRPLNYRILNVYGQEMSRGILSNQQTIIDISRYASGTYYLHTNNETIKIVKK
jgi:hypothetical protein